MSCPRWQEQGPSVDRCQLHADPFEPSGGAGSQVDRNVETTSRPAPHQLGLGRCSHLVMETPDRACRCGVAHIALDPVGVDACRGEITGAPEPGEEAAMVFDPLRSLQTPHQWRWGGISRPPPRPSDPFVSDDGVGIQYAAAIDHQRGRLPICDQLGIFRYSLQACNDHQHMSDGDGFHEVIEMPHPISQIGWKRLPAYHRVMSDHLGAFFQQPADQGKAGDSLTSSVSGLKASPSTATLTPLRSGWPRSTRPRRRSGRSRLMSRTARSRPTSTPNLAPSPDRAAVSLGRSCSRQSHSPLRERTRSAPSPRPWSDSETDALRSSPRPHRCRPSPSPGRRSGWKTRSESPAKCWRHT